MAIRSLCLCADTDALFRDWVVTLNTLVSNRQPVSTLPLFERWRMITINRQWWESDTSGDAATDALAIVESAFIASRTTSPLTSAPSSNASSTLALSTVSHDTLPTAAIAAAAAAIRPMSRPASPTKQQLQQPQQPPRRLGTVVGQRASPPPLARTLDMAPKRMGCCDEVVSDLIDAAITCQARPD
ncbi:hypothetical protein FBU59_006070, partial [Linderina macrospora]